jgi:hypothetical protein
MVDNMLNIIQKKQKIIQCERCGKQFTRLTTLRTHFNNKTSCKPVLKDISIEELKEKYKVNKGVYKCENCNKEYKTSDGKYKHKKKCLVNPIIIEKKENDKLKNELKNVKEHEKLKRKELEEQVKQLLLEKSQIQEQLKDQHIGVMNNTTNNDNSVLNINIINNFGEENIEYLLKDPEFLKRCIESPINSIHRYLDNVHFNKKHPENTNIKVTNLLGPYMDYMKEGKWNKIEKKILIPRIIDKSIDVVDDIIDDNENIDSDISDSDESIYNKRKESWNEYSDIKYGENSKLKEKIISKAKRHIYNNCDKS